MVKGFLYLLEVVTLIAVLVSAANFGIFDFLSPPSPPLPFGGWGLATLLSLWGGVGLLASPKGKPQREARSFFYLFIFSYNL